MRVRKKAEYSAGDLAALFGVAHRTACKMIDTGQLAGHRIPTGHRERRVTHEVLLAFCLADLDRYSYALDRIVGLTKEERKTTTDGEFAEANVG